MINNCPVCSADDVVYDGLYRANHDCFKELKRVHCNTCSLDFASPMPDEIGLEKFNSDYFKSAHSGKPTNKVDNAFFSAIARLRIAHIESHLTRLGKSTSRVLEWGPGYGYFASNWLERKPDTIYHAIETDISCHSMLNDLGVSIVDEHSLPNENKQYDLIVMSHVLEHVTEPLNFLNNATKKLKKDGIIFIEVPCRDWLHKSIDEPHLLFFDKEPMSRLLEKVGFNDISLSYHGETIKKLCSTPKVFEKWTVLRSKLIDMGLIKPFSKMENGMEVLNKPIERAAVAPCKAHLESLESAWWLRAVARKT
jgi:SAM-dependent methyltransferase